jgi:hypothetical protein
MTGRRFENMENLIELENLSPKLRKYLDDRFSALQIQIDELQEEKKKRKKKNISETLNLMALKQEFIDSKPYERTDAFTDWELVFWASLVLSKTSRREKLDNISEVAKRGNRIKQLVDFYTNGIREDNPKMLVRDCDSRARIKVKDFLEYVLLEHPDIPTKDGKTPMLFWGAMSDWSINNFSSRIMGWKQTREIEDKPA